MSENDIKPGHLKALIGQYWSIAYAEGSEKRTTDTPAGDAQRVWHEIESAIDRLTAERDASTTNAARLRFCVNHDSFPTLARNGKTWVLFMRTTANRRSSFFGTTPTEAIDKAMAVRKP